MNDGVAGSIMLRRQNGFGKARVKVVANLLQRP